MNHFPEAWGRPRDDVYGAYDSSHLQSSNPNQHTQSPIVTGTSVVAIKFKDGVVIAADNLASYGSLARFRDVKRLHVFNDKVVVGFGGDVSDMQHINRLLLALDTRENYSVGTDTSVPLHAKNIHTYLSKVFYRRRTEFNPLWNHTVVAGLDGDDRPFLATADLLGTTYSAPCVATGYGAYLAVPILRKLVPDEESAAKLSREEAEKAIRECLKVLFYRDARSLDTYMIATVSNEKGAELKDNEKLEGQSWEFAEGIRGYGTQVN